MSLVYILLAGFLEAGWVVSLKYISSIQDTKAILLTLMLLLLSVYFLHLASLWMNLALAYCLWVSIGLITLLLVDFLVFGHTINVFQIIGCLLITAGIAAIKLGQ